MKEKKGLFGIIIIGAILVVVLLMAFLYFLIKNTGLTITKGDVVVEIGAVIEENNDNVQNNDEVSFSNQLNENTTLQEIENLTNTSENPE